MLRIIYKILDGLLITGFITILVATTIVPQLAPTATPYVMAVIGLVLMVSRRGRDYSVVARALYWISANVSKPITPYNHLIWGLFFIVLAVGAYAHMVTSSADVELWKTLRSSPAFWGTLLLVMAANIAIGVWTAHKKSKQFNKAS